MNKEDYVKAKIECLERLKRVLNQSRGITEVFDYTFDCAYALGKQEKDAERSKEKLMCLRDKSKVCNKCHECDIDPDAWHSMYSR